MRRRLVVFLLLAVGGLGLLVLANRPSPQRPGMSTFPIAGTPLARPQSFFGAFAPPFPRSMIVWRQGQQLAIPPGTPGYEAITRESNRLLGQLVAVQARGTFTETTLEQQPLVVGLFYIQRADQEPPLVFDTPLGGVTQRLAIFRLDDTSAPATVWASGSGSSYVVLTARESAGALSQAVAQAIAGRADWDPPSPDTPWPPPQPTQTPALLTPPAPVSTSNPPPVFIPPPTFPPPPPAPTAIPAEAGIAAPIRLTAPQPLSIRAGAAEWIPNVAVLNGSGRPLDIAWSPAGDSLLMRVNQWGQLWLVRFDGPPPYPLADQVADFAWSPDARYVVYIRADTPVYFSYPGQQPRPSPLQVYAVTPDGQTHYRLDFPHPYPGMFNFLALRAEGVWSNNGAVQITPYDGRPSYAGGPLSPEAMSTGLKVAPDGQAVAYDCHSQLDTGVCVQPRDDGPARLVLLYPDTPLQHKVAWDHTGSALAILAPTSDWQHQALLQIVSRAGLPSRAVLLPSDFIVEAPTWTADDRYLIVSTYQAGTLHLLGIDATSGQFWEIGPPGWNAAYAARPDGRHILWTRDGQQLWTSDVMLSP